MDSRELLRRFERHPDGTWLCTDAAVIETPHGRVEAKPGMVFAYGDRDHELDVAEYLEQLGAQFGS